MDALKRLLATLGFKRLRAATSGSSDAPPGLAPTPSQPWWFAYGFALISTGATLLVLQGLGPEGYSNAPIIIFVFPIILCAYVGGLGPGLLSTLLSTLASVYLVLAPAYSWRIANPVDNAKWISLCGAGTLISFLMARKEQTWREQEAKVPGGLLRSTERKVQTGFVALLACLVSMAAISYPTLVRLREDTAWVVHSHQVIETLRLLESGATDAESDQRGFIITGSEQYLGPYQTALRTVNDALSELRRLTKDNPEQQRRLDVLEPLMADRLAVLKEGIDRRDQAASLISSGKGKELRDRIRAITAEMEAAEEALLIKREALAERVSTVAKIEILGGSALAVIVVAGALWMIGGAFASSRSAEAALRNSRDLLDTRVRERTAELSDANEFLRTSEQQMSGIINSAMDAVITVNERQCIELFNPAAAKMFGCAAAEALGQPLERFIPQRLRTAHAEHVRLFGESNVNYKAMTERGEIHGLRADGTEFPIEASISQAPLGNRKIFTVILRDITERARAEEALRRSEAKFRVIVETSHDGIVFYDAEAVIRYRSPSFRQISGFTDEELVGRSGFETVHPDDLARVRQTWTQVLAEPGTLHRASYRIRHKDGSWRSVETTFQNLFGNPHVLAVVATAQDITDRKRAMEALEESELRYRRLFERSASALAVYEMIYDAQGNPRDFRFVNVNPAFERVTGLSASEVLGRTALEATPEMDDYWIKLFAQVLSTGEGTSFEHYASHLGRHYAGTAYSPRPNHVAVTFMDVTDRRRAEEALEQKAQELARSNADLEQFAYAASHDLKEPLRAVSGFIGLLQRHCEGKLDEVAGEYVAHAVEGASRMESLIDGLLAFSRVGMRGGRFETIDSAQALAVALQNLAATIQETGAQVSRDPLPSVHGDAVQLSSLFQNLIGNALKFRKGEPPRVHVGVERAGRYWHFSVRDNGIGIAPQYFARIFGVFQRLHTRKEYPGTGIGLAICKKIVERHGGRIWVESAPGMGSTFYFSLLDART